ncbi:MAG TPA: MFS transporter, partial [Spirochaetia bacterium]|nr:MFS transporter [Spirochaetia bacterium]
SYRPLFLIVVAASLANLWLLAGTEESHRGHRANAAVPESPRASKRGVEVKRIENGILVRLVSVNLFNGFAIGLTGPLISYWFARKFGVGPSTLGPTFAITFVVTGLASLITGRLSTRIGVVRSVVWARMAGLILLVVLPLLPVYWLAALIYLLRSALNRGTAGARQALAIGLVGDERRGLASSLNTVSMQLPQSAGPTVAGLLLESGQLALPFYAAAVLQGAYLVLYGTMFRKYEPTPRGRDGRNGRRGAP